MFLANEIGKLELKNTPHISVVGSLTYAIVCMKWNIVYTSGQVGQFMANQGKLHRVDVKHIIMLFTRKIQLGDQVW
jgi:hypothetical protein